MEATLHSLGDLLVKAIPTVLFFCFLTIYLKYVFFRPLARILDARKEATEGVRQLAEKAFAQADQKTSEFERALQLARAEIEQENEALRRTWTEEQRQAIAEARAQADHDIHEAKLSIARDVETARAELGTTVQTLSDRIVSSLLERRAA